MASSWATYYAPRVAEGSPIQGVQRCAACDLREYYDGPITTRGIADAERS